MRLCPECDFPIDHFRMNHCPKCDGPASREIREGVLEVDVAHAGETWEQAREKNREGAGSSHSLSPRRFKNRAWLRFDVGSLYHWPACDGFLASFGRGAGRKVCEGPKQSWGFDYLAKSLMTKLVLREVDAHLVLFEDDASTTTFRDFFFHGGKFIGKKTSQALKGIVGKEEESLGGRGRGRSDRQRQGDSRCDRHLRKCKW